MLSALLALSSLLPLWRVLFSPDYFLGARDLLRSYIPAKWLWLQSMTAFGRIPHWNPWINGGREYLADLSSGPLYPLNFVLLAFPAKHFLWAFSWLIALHFPLLFIGALCLLRSFGFLRTVSLLMALAYAWSGLAISATNNPNILAAMAALPLFVGSVRFWVFRGGKTGLLGSVIALAWPIYFGAPDFTLFLALCSPFTLFRGRKAAASYLRLGIAVALAFLVSLPQLLPAVPLLSRSDRAAGLDLAQVLQFSLHPLSFFALFLGDFFGNVVPAYTYWGGGLAHAQGDIPLLFSDYLGFFLPGAVFLALLREKVWSRKVARFLIPAALAFWLAIGVHGLLYEALAEHLPWWRIFRYPEKWVCVAALPLTLLAAAGLQRWLATLRSNGPREKILAGHCALLATALAACILGGPQWERSITKALLLFSLFEILWIALLFSSSRKQITARTAFALFGLVVATDLLRNSVNLIWESPISVLENPVAKQIASDIRAREREIAQGGPERIASLEEGELAPRETGGPEALDNVSRTLAITAERFAPNVAMLYGLADISWYNGVLSGERVRWWNDLQTEHRKRLLDLMGAYYILPRHAGEPFLRNPDALPFVSAPPEVEFVPDYAAAIAGVRADLFNGKKKLLVESGSVPVSQPSGARFRVSRSIDLIKIEIEKPGSGSRPFLLLVNEGFSPGWSCQPHCRILGRANGWALAVEIYPGEGREFELTFR